MKTTRFRRFSSVLFQIWTSVPCLFFVIGFLLAPAQAHGLLSDFPAVHSAQPSGTSMQHSEDRNSASNLVSIPAVANGTQHRSLDARTTIGTAPCEEHECSRSHVCLANCIHCAACSFTAMPDSFQPGTMVIHVVQRHEYPLRQVMPESPQRHPPYRPPID